MVSEDVVNWRLVNDFFAALSVINGVLVGNPEDTFFSLLNGYHLFCLVFVVAGVVNSGTSTVLPFVC